MLAYAASRQVQGKRQSSPNALLLIIGAHIALVAAVMSAKMDLPLRPHHGPITVTFEPLPVPPPNRIARPQPHPPATIPISDPPPNVELPQLDPISTGQGPVTAPGQIAGARTAVTPRLPALNLVPIPVRHDARLLTPPSELRPPYPHSKILSEEEATLQLRLTISDSGRVTSVDPVGGADREFLDTARRYLIAHWRYQPATEDGRAITSSTVITLRFQLDG